VTGVVLDAGAEIAADPLTTDHPPVQPPGRFPVTENDELLHCSISTPAAAVWFVVMFTVTFPETEGQLPPVVYAVSVTVPLAISVVPGK
jgi:hypothetical protein